VRRDLAYGYITPAQAVEDYGLSEAEIAEIITLARSGADF
jgi:hypothetical protein